MTESEAARTVRGTFTGVGDPKLVKLDALFAGAEKWIESDRDADDWTVAQRVFVRHPRYPHCTMLVEATFRSEEGAAPSVSRVTVKRTVTDDGNTPISAFSQTARYSWYLARFLEKRRGGPMPTPEVDKLAIVEKWQTRKGRQRQKDFAAAEGISTRQLRRWEKDFREEGKLIDSSS